MLEKYKIVKEHNEDVLYLYYNMNYEFSSEFDQQKLEEKTNEWLLNQQLDFQGNKIVIVVDGIVGKVMTMDNLKNGSDQEVIELENGQTMSMSDVLLSLLFTNVKLELPIEVLKAIVVLYRSELLKIKEENQKLMQFHNHFSFVSHVYYKLSYPHTYRRYEEIYRKAIKETAGQYLTYNDKKIEAFIHIASNGYTEEKKDIPYLIRKESFWDFTYPNYLQLLHFSVEELKEKLHLEDDNYHVHIMNVSKSNRIEKLKIGNKVLSSADMQIYLGLSSSDATILVEKDGLTFVTRGVGNGYGLSLWGARALANLDCNYLQILGYYFQKVILHE